MSIFYEVLKEDEAIVQAALSDIIAYRERVRYRPLSWLQRVLKLTCACAVSVADCANCCRIQRATNTRRRCCTTKATMQCRCVPQASHQPRSMQQKTRSQLRGFHSSGLRAVSLRPASVPGTPRCASAVAARPDHHGARSAEPDQVGPKSVLPAAMSLAHRMLTARLSCA